MLLDASRRTLCRSLSIDTRNVLVDTERRSPQQTWLTRVSSPLQSYRDEPRNLDRSVQPAEAHWVQRADFHTVNGCTTDTMTTVKTLEPVSHRLQAYASPRPAQRTRSSSRPRRFPRAVSVTNEKNIRTLANLGGGCRDAKGTKLRVDNIHYDLTEDDLDVRRSQ